MLLFSGRKGMQYSYFQTCQFNFLSTVVQDTFLSFTPNKKKNLVIRYFRINNGLLKKLLECAYFFPDQTHSMLLDFMMHFLQKITIFVFLEKLSNIKNHDQHCQNFFPPYFNFLPNYSQSCSQKQVCSVKRCVYFLQLPIFVVWVVVQVYSELRSWCTSLKGVSPTSGAVCHQSRQFDLSSS